jgi:hypothetical protein
MERVIAGITLTVAFLVMASVFVPERSEAGDGPHGSPDAADDHLDGVAETSTAPHVGLPSLGSFTGRQYVVEVYATEVGPRYTVYDRLEGFELGVLLTTEQMQTFFPELLLPDTDFSAGEPDQLIMADPSLER